MLTIFLNSKATGPFWKLLKNLWIIRYICVNSKWPKSTLALLVFFNLPSFWKWHSQMFICKCWNIYHMEFLITSDTDMLLKQDHVSIAFRYFDYQLFIRSHLLCRPLNMGKLGHVYYGGGRILKCQHIPLEKNVSLVAKWFYLEKWIPQSFVFKFMKLFTHSVTANWYANFSRSVESGELPVCLRLYDFFVFVRKDSGLKVLFLLNLFNMVKIKEKCTHAIACIHCIIQKHI